MISEKINKTAWRNNTYDLFLFIDYGDIYAFGVVDMSDSGIDISILVHHTSVLVA